LNDDVISRFQRFGSVSSRLPGALLRAFAFRAFGADSVMDILSEILASKRLVVEKSKRALALDELRKRALCVRANATVHSLRNALTGDGINIIAEFKRRSPSKGTIRENADAAMIARSYQSGGAAAISVLTEEKYFAGSLDDLRAVRREIQIPILRKDFILDDYQLYESAAAGADALLLIIAALDDETLARMLRLTEAELGMDALVEVHTKEEMARAVAHGAMLIGVNNRDLRTFDVSTATSLELAQMVPANTVLVSESGLTPEEVRRLRAVGYRGFLVGEDLMRAEDPEQRLRAFRGKN
jgi:indole-3-glycerol phosphate synthase